MPVCGKHQYIPHACNRSDFLTLFCYVVTIVNGSFLFRFIGNLFGYSCLYGIDGIGRQSIGNNIEFPIPPLSEQQRIVDILDRFDALVNDLSAGLPAEIEARRKQYEYYRDTLLTFKRKAE